MIHQKPRRSFAIRFFGFPGIALLLAAFAVPQAKAETANLSGFWMGTGMVLLSNSGPSRRNAAPNSSRMDPTLPFKPSAQHPLEAQSRRRAFARSRLTPMPAPSSTLNSRLRAPFRLPFAIIASM